MSVSISCSICNSRGHRVWKMDDRGKGFLCPRCDVHAPESCKDFSLCSGSDDDPCVLAAKFERSSAAPDAVELLAVELSMHDTDTMSQDSGKQCICGSDSRFTQQDGDDPQWETIDVHRAQQVVRVLRRATAAVLANK